MSVILIVQPNPAGEFTGQSSDPDGLMKEMAQATAARKREKGNEVILCTNVKCLKQVTLGSQPDKIIFAGHHQATETDLLPSGDLKWIPVNDRRAGGLKLPAYLKTIRRAIESNCYKFTFLCCQFGDSLITQAMKFRMSQSRHRTRTLDCGYMYEVIGYIMDTSSRSTISSLDVVALGLIASISRGTLRLNRSVTLKGPIGYGFFHGTAQTNGSMKFRTFPATYYCKALELGISSHDDRSVKRWAQFEEAHVTKNPVPYSIKYVIQPGVFERMFHQNDTNHSLLHTLNQLFPPS